MRSIPRRQSLVGQTAAILREEILAGGWREWLPGERALCESLHVSRNTLRAALEHLKREGIIRSDHGAGNRILARPASRKPRLRSHDVALVSPEALDKLRPSQTLGIDDLRAMLSERGCQLHVFEGPQYFRESPAARKKLVTQNPHGCWVLLLASETMLDWFQREKLPCVVVGTVRAGISLPHGDLNHRAMCRHAAGVFLGLGHRRLGMLIRKSDRGGDLESVAGFTEGVRQSPHAAAEELVGFHDATPAGIGQAVRRMMERKFPPTALLVANAYHYLAVTSLLTKTGWRIPQDVSVISRDDDPFLPFVSPLPARYVANPHALARALIQPVMELLEGNVVTQRSELIMPEFSRGETLGPPRK